MARHGIKRGLALLLAGASLGLVLSRSFDAQAQELPFAGQKLGKLNDHTALVQGDGPQAPKFSELGVRVNGMTTDPQGLTHYFNSFCGVTPDVRHEERMGETSYTFDARFGLVNFTGLPGALVIQTYKPGDPAGYVYVISPKPAGQEGSFLNAYQCQHDQVLSRKGLEANVAEPLKNCVLMSGPQTREKFADVTTLMGLYQQTVAGVCADYLDKSKAAKEHSYTGPNGDAARARQMESILDMQAAGIRDIPATK